MNIPPCPRCNTNREVTERRGEPGEFTCHKCRGNFDGNPDEGGTHSDFNPAARIEREERRQQNRAQDRFRRR